MPDIYSYLRTALHKALSRVFSSIIINPESISLFFKSPGLQDDLCTPVAFKIASSVNISPVNAAQKIILFFEWDDNFIIPDPLLKHSISSGFICFRTSDSFQYRSLKDAAGSEFIDFTDPFDNSNFSYIREIGQILIPLLKHTSSLKYDIETVNYDLLQTEDERKLLRLVAVSRVNELYSGNASLFFMQKIASVLHRYLHQVSIFTSNSDLTNARLELLKGSYNRLISLHRRTS